MAAITTTGNVHDATFAGKQYRIIVNGNAAAIWCINGDTLAQVDPHSTEARSLMRLFQWHHESKRVSSELPVLFIVGEVASE